MFSSNPFLRKERPTTTTKTRFQHNLNQFPTLSDSNVVPQTTHLKYDEALQLPAAPETNKEEKDMRGWIVLTKDQRYIPENEKEPDVSFLMDTIQQSLTKLYIQRSNEKLEIYGDEIYDQHFHFQNYDYNYFSKLDHCDSPKQQFMYDYDFDNDYEYESNVHDAIDYK